MKVKELRQMISKIVEEEVKRIIPQIMSEMYVKKIVTEAIERVSTKERTREKSLMNIMEDFNNHENQTIFSKKSLKNPLLDEKINPMAYLYEGTKDEDELLEGNSVPLNIPEATTTGYRSIYEEIFDRASGRSMEPDPASIEERRLAAYREKLDSMKV